MDNTQAIILLSPEQQQGWIKVGQKKNDLAIRQQNAALELQQILLNPGTTISAIETSLGNYRKAHAAMVVAGQTFRKLINDKVLQPSLDIEKEYSPKTREDYLKVEKQLIALKQEAEKVNNAAAAKETEKQLYVAHVRNEYERIIADYKIRWAYEMNTMYISWLKAGIKEPDFTALSDTLKEFKLATGTPFNSTILTQEDRAPLFKSIAKPNFQVLQDEMLGILSEKVMSYQHDLKANAVSQVEQQAAFEVQTLQKDAEVNIGINQLQAQAVAVPTVVAEGKALKRAVEIVIEGSETWAIIVISSFLKAPSLMRSHITVKSWENLTVKQMAKALGDWATESGETFEGLQYREIIK